MLKGVSLVFLLVFTHDSVETIFDAKLLTGSRNCCQKSVLYPRIEVSKLPHPPHAKMELFIENLRQWGSILEVILSVAEVTTEAHKIVK